VCLRVFLFVPKLGKPTFRTSYLFFFYLRLFTGEMGLTGLQNCVYEPILCFGISAFLCHVFLYSFRSQNHIIRLGHVYIITVEYKIGVLRFQGQTALHYVTLLISTPK
jgi:hypothetical protein